MNNELEYTPLTGKALEEAILEYFQQPSRYLNIMETIKSFSPEMLAQFDKAMKEHVKNMEW